MPSKYYSIGSRDLNEPKIVEILDRYGIEYRKMDKKIGADLLILVNPMEFWEIKNPEQDWSLTKSEQKLKEHCGKAGIRYRIVITEEQAAYWCSAYLRLA